MTVGSVRERRSQRALQVPVAENGTFFERRLHTGAVGHRNPFRVPLRAEEKIPECQKNRVFTGLRNPVVGKLSSPEKLWQMMAWRRLILK